MRKTSSFVLIGVLALAPDAAHAAALDGAALRWPWALPFIGILLTIAVGPLLFPRVWHHHYGKIAFAWGTLALVPIAALYDVPTATAAFVHALLGEYLSFIVLLFTLYVVAGGILVTGELRGTPLVNTAILAFGTLIASIVGTTGAAMILIRPLLRANANRLHNVHVVVFFIILVANIGGALTPLGDPPLFVGFLRGVDFFWTTQHLWLQTAILAAIVLALFVVVDLWFHRQDRRVTLIGEPPPPPMRLQGPGQHQFPAARRRHRRDPASHRYGSPASSSTSTAPRSSFRSCCATSRWWRSRSCRSCSRPTSIARATASPGSRSARSRSCSPASSPASFRCWRCCRPAGTARSAGCRR